MGNLWLPDMPDWLQDSGYRVETFPGYLTRSRSSGGYDDIHAIGVHHAAASQKMTWENFKRSLWEWHQYKPVGALGLNRDGTWCVGAAGCTNTQGRGGPVQTSVGQTPLDSANRFWISVEPLNDGSGEVWSSDILNSYTRGCAAIVKGLEEQGAWDAANRRYRKIKLDPGHDVFAHFEWAPNRKIDPAGPPGLPYGFANMLDPSRIWFMNKFREQTRSNYLELKTPQGDEMIPVNQRMMDSRVLGSRFQEGREYTLVLPAFIPQTARGLMIGLTYVDPTEVGHVECWAKSASRPEPGQRTSVHNFNPAIPVLGRSSFIDCTGGGFKLMLMGGSAHLIIDIQGYSL